MILKASHTQQRRSTLFRYLAFSYTQNLDPCKSKTRKRERESDLSNLHSYHSEETERELSILKKIIIYEQVHVYVCARKILDPDVTEDLIHFTTKHIMTTAKFSF